LRRSSHACNQPDNQCYQAAEECERQQHNQESPTRSFQRRNVACDGSLWIAVKLTSNNRQVAGDLRSALDANIAEYGGHTASHLRTLLDDYISVNRDRISSHVTAHKDGTIYAYEIARLLSRIEKDVMIRLDPIRVLLR
jgi:hypothetical protein